MTAAAFRGWAWLGDAMGAPHEGNRKSLRCVQLSVKGETGMPLPGLLLSTCSQPDAVIRSLRLSPPLRRLRGPYFWGAGSVLGLLHSQSTASPYQTNDGYDWIRLRAVYRLPLGNDDDMKRNVCGCGGKQVALSSPNDAYGYMHNMMSERSIYRMSQAPRALHSRESSLRTNGESERSPSAAHL